MFWLIGVRSLANASRARQFNPLNPPGVGWVNIFICFKVRVYIRTCVPNLGAIRRERFLTIYNPLNPPGVGWVKLFIFFKVRVSIRTCVPNLGGIRRERFVTIYNPLNPPGVGWVNFFFEVRLLYPHMRAKFGHGAVRLRGPTVKYIIGRKYGRTKIRTLNR